MKVLIEIDDSDYADIMSDSERNLNHYERLIKNGTPLPKGHGRLIDADALEKKMCDRGEELGDAKALWESSAVSVALNTFAPTIIEADTESVIHWGCSDAEIVKSFIKDVEAVKDLLPQESDHKCHTCKHYTSGERDGSCGSYICKNYSDWESEDK